MSLTDSLMPASVVVCTWGVLESPTASLAILWGTPLQEPLDLPAEQKTHIGTLLASQHLNVKAAWEEKDQHGDHGIQHQVRVAAESSSGHGAGISKNRRTLFIPK